MIGRLLGERYEILSEIAEGGMSHVYKGKCNKLNRIVAIKVLKAEFNNNGEIVQKFKREATAVATLNDDNIVDVLDVGSQDNINYIVMEYIDGKTLKDLIVEYDKIPYEVSINIGIQVAKALDCAHRNGIVHRDIKPHNILITREGQVKVTDFGIAKSSNSSTLTSTSSVLGSAHYFSPEQAKGSHIDERTDIYSLGIVLYEMVTGRVPFDADSPVSVALKHIQESPIPPKEITSSIPDSLNELILTCMEKLPENRYQNAKEVMRDLSRIRENPNVRLGRGYFDDTTQSTRVMDAATTAIPVVAPIGYDEEGNPYYDDAEGGDYYGEYEDGYDEYGDGYDEYGDGYDNYEYDQDDEEEKDGFWNDEEEDVDSNSKQSKTTNPNKKKNIIIAALVAIIAIVSIGVGIFVFGGKSDESEGTGKKVEVPDVVGKHKDEAKKILEDAGFKMTITEYDSKSKEAAGTVIEMYPEAGMEKEEGSEVRVVVAGEDEKEEPSNSGSSSEDKMPNLKGMTEEEAKAALKELGITSVNVKTEYSNETPEGQVISQTPSAKSSITSSTKVTLVISNGKKEEEEEIKVPSVIGLKRDSAKDILERRGFVVKIVTKPVGNSNDDGYVVDCSRNDGETVKKGSSITITIGKYEGKTVNEKEIVGMTRSEAEQWAKNNGVTVNFTGNSDANAKVGTVSKDGNIITATMML